MTSSNDDCQDIIRRFDELDAAYSGLQKNGYSFDDNKQNSTIFITQFNELFNTSYTNLNDILDFLRMKNMTDLELQPNTLGLNMTDFQAKVELQMQNQGLPNENTELKHEIQRLQANCKAYQSKIEKLEKGLFKLHRKNINLAFEKETLTSKLDKLKYSLDSNSKPQLKSTIESNEPNHNLQFDKMYLLLNSANLNFRKCQEQRKALIKVVEKQNMILDHYEAIIKDFKHKQQLSKNVNSIKVNNDPITDDIDNLYSILGSLTKLVEQSPNHEIKGTIKGIILDSSKQVQERIINTFSYLISSLQSTENSISETKEKSIADHHDEVNEQKRRSLRILSVMDEELLFLQQLAKHSDIQSIVFPNDQKITASFKSQLVDHCSKISQFIEQTLPKVSINSEIDKLPSLNIFEHILTPNDITEKITRCYENIVRTDEGREIFQLFASEVIIASILRKYAIDCKIRLEKTRQTMNEMQTIVDNSTNLKNKISFYYDREMKMRDMLSSMFDTNPQTDFLTIFEAVIKYFKNQSENLPIISDLKVAIAQNNREHSKEIKKIKKQYANEIKTIRKQYSMLENQIATQNTERKSHLARIKELELKNKTLNDQAKDSEKFYLEKNNQIIINHENEKKDLEKKIASLSDQIAKKDNEISEQLNSICVLKKEILQTKKRNDDLEQFLLESRNMISIKMNQLKASYETTLQTLTKKIQACNALEKEIENLNQTNANLTNSLEQVKLENKTIRIQLKSNEEKWQNELSTLSLKLSSQLQAVTNDYSAKIVNIESEIEKFSQAVGYSELNLNPNCDGFTKNLGELASRINNDMKLNFVYSSFYKTVVTKLKSVKEVKDTNAASDTIQDLIEENQALREKIETITTKMQTELAYIQRMKQLDQENTEKLIELKRWEIWGKRQFKAINGIDFDRDEKIQFDQIRSIIEEEIWLSQGSSNNEEISNTCTTILENIDEHIIFGSDDIQHQKSHQRPKTLLPGIPPAD